MSKGKPTPKRRDVLAAQREWGDMLRSWLRRKRPEPEQIETGGGGHGVTVLMRNIRPRPPEYVKRHVAPAGFDRRHKRTESGALVTRAVPLHASNEPHVIEEGRRTRDRSLRGKARRRARKSGRGTVAVTIDIRVPDSLRGR